MASAQVVETSVKVTSNSPSQDYTLPDDHNLLTYDMTPGFKPFTKQFLVVLWTVLKIKQFLVVFRTVVKTKQFSVIIRTVVKIKAVFGGYLDCG